MSLCDTCMQPGHCCKKVFLSSGNEPFLQAPMSYERAEHAAIARGLPFVPGEQLPDGRWLWSCYHLQRDGRCGIYENRPQLCRDFLPGSGPLCVHYWEREENGEAVDKSEAPTGDPAPAA